MDRSNGFIKNLFMVLSSNLIVLGLGVLISFILPLYLSIENYGYWQLYNYYIGFVGLFMFGFSDGMNLRYSGVKPEELNKNIFKNFLRFTILFSALMAVILFLLALCLPNNSYKVIYIFIIINIFLFNVNGFFIHLNQMTFQFKQYSIANSMERILFVIFLIGMFYFGVKDFTLYIVLNIICRILALIYNIYTCKEVVFFSSSYSIKDIKGDIQENFVSGFPLTIASICSMLMTTMPRFIVGKLMTISSYGIFSFGSTTLNLVIQIIFAMSTVFYPTLKRLNREKSKFLYSKLNNVISILCGISLVTYYFTYPLITFAFKKYIPVLDYLYLLFPTLYYQSMNSLVISNFSRVLRLEKKYFVSNVTFLAINFVISYLVGYYTHSIKAILLVSLFIMQLWILYGQSFINSEFGVKTKDYLGISLVFIFIILNIIFSYTISFFIYSIIIILVVIYVLKYKKVSLNILGDK